MADVNTSYMYICKRVLEGRDKDVCSETSDCPHARPHEKRLVTNHQFCDTYGLSGPCDVCVVKSDDWDR